MRANVGRPRHKLRRWTRDPSALKGPPAEGGGELALARTGRSSVPTREKAGTANKRRAGARPDSRGRLSPQAERQITSSLPKQGDETED